MLNELNKKYFLLSNIAIKRPRCDESTIAICCPLCKEGKSWNKKQRCYLYHDKNLNKDLVKCFNCGFTGSPAKFFKEVSHELYAKYKTEMRNISLENLKNYKNNQDNTIVYEPKVYPINLDLKPLRDEHKEYLRKRGLEKYIEENIFFTSDKDYEYKNKFIPIKNTLIAPLYNKEGLLYGFQARMIDKKRFFIIINGDSGYKVWNLNNIKNSKYVFIFESIFDALSSGLPLNSIVAGLGIDVPVEHFNGKKIIYCLDNQHIDETSRKKSYELLNKHYVMIWPKTYNCKQIDQKDFNEMLIFGYTYDDIRHFIINNIYEPNSIKGKLLLKI